MSVYEAVAEGQRRFMAERNARLEAEAAALAAKQAAEAEKERNADRDRRREEARQAACLAHLAKWQSGPAWQAAESAASAASAALDAVLAQPKATVSQLFAAYSDATSTAATIEAFRNCMGDGRYRATHPGERPMVRYLDRTPKPGFDDLLTQVIASRAAAAASTAPSPNDVFAKADQAGDAAAKAIQS